MPWVCRILLHARMRKVVISVVVDSHYHSLSALVVEPLEGFRQRLQHERTAPSRTVNPIRPDFPIRDIQQFREKHVKNDVVPPFHMKANNDGHDSQALI